MAGRVWGGTHRAKGQGSTPPHPPAPPVHPAPPTRTRRAAGACAATLLAWWVHSWRWATLLGALAALAYAATWPVVMESPQWLLLHGHKVRRPCRGRGG